MTLQSTDRRNSWVRDLFLLIHLLRIFSRQNRRTNAENLSFLFDLLRLSVLNSDTFLVRHKIIPHCPQIDHRLIVVSQQQQQTILTVSSSSSPDFKLTRSSMSPSNKPFVNSPSPPPPPPLRSIDSPGWQSHNLNALKWIQFLILHKPISRPFLY